MFKSFYTLTRLTASKVNIQNINFLGTISQNFINQNVKLLTVKYQSNQASLYLINQRDYSSKKIKEKGKKIDKPRVELRKNEIDEFVDHDNLLNSMSDSIEYLKKDYNDNLNLRLTPSSFEQLTVKTAQGPMKLGELAQVEAKSANSFVIDLMNSPEYVKPVYNAILNSNMNLNPQMDKTSVYIQTSKITREHRENMAKSAKLKCENVLKRMRDVESKALRKTKETKNANSDLRYNVGEWIKYQFELSCREAKQIRDAKIKEILQE